MIKIMVTTVVMQCTISNFCVEASTKGLVAQAFYATICSVFFSSTSAITSTSFTVSLRVTVSDSNSPYILSQR